MEKQINQQQNRNRQRCNSLHRVFKNEQKATVCREQIFHISGKKKKIALTLLRGHYRHKKIRRIWSMREHNGSGGTCGQKRSARWKGPKQHPELASFAPGNQPRPGEPAVSRGHLPTCTNLTGPEEATGCTLPHLWLMCLYNGAAPGAKEEEEFPDVVLSRLHQKIAGGQQGTSTFRISCVWMHNCKTQMTSTRQSQILYKQALLFMEMIWLLNRVENLAEDCSIP